MEDVVPLKALNADAPAPRTPRYTECNDLIEETASAFVDSASFAAVTNVTINNYTVLQNLLQGAVLLVQ